MLTPQQLAANGSEHAEQTALFQWASQNVKRYSQLALLFAVPNGAELGGASGKRVTGSRMKAEGLKAGVPDVCWPWPTFPWPGLWIELKRVVYAPETMTNGKVRGGLNEDGRVVGGRQPKQIELHRRLRDVGYPVVTAYGWESAAWVLEAYANGRLDMKSSDCLFVWKDLADGQFKFI